MSNTALPHTEILPFAHQLATRAGEMMREFRASQSFTVSEKGKRELVTSADTAIDSFIRASIQERFPSDAILSEELAPALVAEEIARGGTWVIDPIDGTVNYAHGHLQTCVSIGWLWKGAAHVGVVYAPFQEERFVAVRGHGATLNGTRIRCSAETQLSDSLVATGFPYSPESRASALAMLGKVLGSVRDIRRLGSGALDICWVGCGRLQGFFETLSPWDIAAARLIAVEAGARVTNLTASENSTATLLSPGGRNQDTKQTAPSETATGDALQEPIFQELNGRNFMIAAPGIFEELHALLSSM